MDGRVPTFAITHESVSPQAAAERLGERGFAVWHGNYYAVEIMRRLGLDDGAVRVGIVHYNTEDEVARLLARARPRSRYGYGRAGRLGERRARRAADRVGVDAATLGLRERQQVEVDDVDDRVPRREHASRRRRAASSTRDELGGTLRGAPSPSSTNARVPGSTAAR